MDNKRKVLYRCGNWMLVREYDAGSDTGIEGEPNGYQGWVEYYTDEVRLKATASCIMVANVGLMEDDFGYTIDVPLHVLNAIDKYWDELENYSEEVSNG